MIMFIHFSLLVSMTSSWLYLISGFILVWWLVVIGVHMEVPRVCIQTFPLIIYKVFFSAVLGRIFHAWNNHVAILRSWEEIMLLSDTLLGDTKKGISSIPSSVSKKNINSPSCGSNPDMNTAETVGLMSWWNCADQAQGSCSPEYIFCFTLDPCSFLKFLPFITLIIFILFPFYFLHLSVSDPVTLLMLPQVKAS